MFNNQVSFWFSNLHWDWSFYYLQGGGAAILHGVNFKILTDWFLGSFFDKGVLHGGHFNKFQESSTK